MDKGTCSIEDCEKPRKSRGWCGMHYRRWWKYGDPTVKKYGHPPTPCSIDGCDAPVCAQGWCRKHYVRWYRNGSTDDPARDRVVGYAALHYRLKSRRGPASEHPCHCGRRAKHWAYDHSDSDQLYDKGGWPYSLDLDRYQPMCSSCHSRFDQRRKKVA